MDSLYDTIGIDYANLRRPDLRIAKLIEDALGDAETVLNVGAGAGSYEPTQRAVTAVEPSQNMINQRGISSTLCIRARAENLPFEDKSFDAAMATLTIHHWTDKEAGAAEIRRVTRDKIVFLTFDPSFTDFWLYDYFPELVALDEGQMPKLTDYENWFAEVDISPVPIPYDCTDGFLAAYWRRPHAYLDERVRRAMSSFWSLGDVSKGLDNLKNDLESGAWKKRYGQLLDKTELDCGYRLVIAD